MCTELHEEQQTDTDDRSDGFKRKECGQEM